MIFRTLFFIFIYLPVLLVGVPVQFIITRLGLYSNTLTFLFHRLGCIFLGLRVKTLGQPLHNRPTLLLANHISWTDIIAIGSVADVTFVSKMGVKNTFFVGFMASLQRTLWVDYGRKQDAGRISREMGKRLAKNGAVLLFAEGHRDLGDHVQPFRSALVGAAQAAMNEGGITDVAIQPVTIAYTHLQGLPVSRNERPDISGLNARGFRQVVGNLLTSGIK
ncbi:MAG: lysophospholipid acyltransferase family protein, partial [Devosia sp.]